MSDILPHNEIKPYIENGGAVWLEQNRDLSTVSEVEVLNKDLAWLVDVTLDAACNNNKNTVRSYQTAIGLFLEFINRELGDRLPSDWQPLARKTQAELKDKRNRTYTKTVWEFRGKVSVLRTVSAATVDSFVAWLLSEGAGGGTVDGRKSAVMTFLRVALRENVLTEDQKGNLDITPYKPKKKRNGSTTGRRLTVKEVRALRKAVKSFAKSTNKIARDRAIIDCMLFAGLRRSEVANLTTGTFVQDGGRWWFHLRENQTKGGEPRRVKVHDTLYKSLIAWLDILELEIGKGEDPVFYGLTKGGNPTGKISGGVIGRIVGEYGYLANIAPQTGANTLGAHDLRRTCARNAYDNGASILQVQNMLGHADPKTTIRYIGAHESDDNTAVDCVRY